MKIVIVSSAVPRRCGLAAYTDDLRAALQDVTGWQVRVCAIDRDDLQYGPETRYVVRQDVRDDYRKAAAAIAADATDLVLIEHEFGIFGGPAGSYVLDLADELRLRVVPFVVTLHTVLAQPDADQRRAVKTLSAGAARITVFAREGRRLAARTGVAPMGRVVVVPHGAPSVLRHAVADEDVGVDTRALLLASAGQPTLTTFGLLSPGKGVEHGIRAVAHLAAAGHKVHYLVVGATHPEVARCDGEAYRDSLLRLTQELGVVDDVRFLDTFVTEAELSAVLAHTDIVLTPYRSTEQISSGVLTFALAAGRPVVSTEYRYAVEMLAADASGVAPGALVPAQNALAIADAVSGLLASPDLMAKARAAADRVGQDLTWPEVSRRLAEVLADAAAAHRRLPAGPGGNPPVLVHLDALVDARGVIQFAQGAVPLRESGYCVDDMARLGIVGVGLAGTVGDDDRPRRWMTAATEFLDAAFDGDGMHNVMDADGRWADDPHIGDHLGRAIWAAGRIAASAHAVPATRRLASSLRRRAVLMLPSGAAPRTLAFALLGMTATVSDEFDADIRAAGTRLAQSGEFRAGWRWFEPILTYDNARLPHALLAAGRRLNDRHMTTCGLSTLDWYLAQVGLAGTEPMLRLIGNAWRHRDRPSVGHDGDEQPVDAAAVVEALVCAWQQTGEVRYARLARRAFAWFHGANRAGRSLYDQTRGGCRDGLTSCTVSRNQGAESTLAYYQAMVAVSEAGLLTSGPAPQITYRLQPASAASSTSITSGSWAYAIPMTESAAP
ncbi:MAG: glycosyltransferase [Hamadaea sp.]|nr:glycosyltransferase [Hamadaea sp.]